MGLHRSQSHADGEGEGVGRERELPQRVGPIRAPPHEAPEADEREPTQRERHPRSAFAAPAEVGDRRGAGEGEQDVIERLDVDGPGVHERLLCAAVHEVLDETVDRGDLPERRSVRSVDDEVQGRDEPEDGDQSRGAVAGVVGEVGRGAAEDERSDPRASEQVARQHEEEVDDNCAVTNAAARERAVRGAEARVVELEHRRDEDVVADHREGRVCAQRISRDEARAADPRCVCLLGRHVHAPPRPRS